MPVGEPIPLNEEHSHHHAQNDELEKEYGKLSLVFLGIFAVTIVIFLAVDGHGLYQHMTQFQGFLAQLMGVFFIVFAGFKLVNLQSFAHGFAMYDLIAKKSMFYAKLYPFIQLMIGVGMFIIPDKVAVHIAALIVSAIAIIGVINSLMNKHKIHCACLGNVIKMPLATVSAIEDGSMLVISAYMVIAMLL